MSRKKLNESSKSLAQRSSQPNLDFFFVVRATGSWIARADVSTSVRGAMILSIELSMIRSAVDSCTQVGINLGRTGSFGFSKRGAAFLLLKNDRQEVISILAALCLDIRKFSGLVEAFSTH